MYTPIITGSGVYTPENVISNAELVDSFNAYVDLWNARNAAEIEAGEKDALAHSSAEFIEKASGIKSRFVLSKDPILDPEIMAPRIPARPDSEPSVLAEMAVKAAQGSIRALNRKNPHP